MPVASIARPSAPPSASISRTICPLPTPPMAGLQLIWPTESQFVVSSAVFAPSRAAASAASVPAWPAPTTITSYSYVLEGMLLRYRNEPAPHTAARSLGRIEADQGAGAV